MLPVLNKSNYDKFPKIDVHEHSCTSGWEAITTLLFQEIQALIQPKTIVALETYHGVYVEEISNELKQALADVMIIDTSTALREEAVIADLIQDFVTNDPVFGYVCPFQLQTFFDEQKLTALQHQIQTVSAGNILVIGVGATLVVPEPDLLLYADMPRWEIQLRFRKKRITNLGATNYSAPFTYQYKRAFYVDWKVLDRHKKTLLNGWDYMLDTTREGFPKLVSGEAIKDALNTAIQRPFRVVPFFDPGPWGGQWLKEVCDLDRSAVNYAWGFDCVPEENSLVFAFSGDDFELPSINLVFAHPIELLGEKVYEAFGTEFPIRFDFLDTMAGGNLSLQVHPLQAYIREKFGMPYTQNESYYFLDAKADAVVYLGFKEDITPGSMVSDLEKSLTEGQNFDAEKYVAKWPIKKHGHVLIPAGTIHCSGANSVVLEISATPFNFTFKLWDWGRLGLDGRPRPISLEHGKNNLQWDRTAQWTGENLIDQIEPVDRGDGWREERTGLDEGSFIETRRHWFTKKVMHNTQGVVNVLNLIEGREAVVESPTGAFEPFVIHYAETFIVPAAVGDFTIRPHGPSEGKELGTIKAYIRTDKLQDYRID